MRRMFSEEQLKRLIENSSSEVLNAIKNKDIQVNGITSKGIANTGGLANIGNVAITGNLDVISGTIKGNLRMSDIKDSAGNSRFIEGTVNNGEYNLDTKYAKWSLSGTHLLMVFAFKLETLIRFNENTNIATFTVPSWIRNKIYSLTGSESGVVARLTAQPTNEYGNAIGNSFSYYVYVNSNSNTVLLISSGNYDIGQTDTTSYVRMTLDLLIDSDYSE